MLETGKKEKNLRSFFTVIAGVSTLVLIIFIYSFMGAANTELILVEQDQPCDLSLDGQPCPAVSLKDFSYPLFQAGQEICYSMKLKGSVRTPALRLLVTHSTVRVFLDDTLLYEYGQDKHLMYGYGYLSIPLPQDYEGRTLRVEMTVHESNELRRLRPPVIVNADSYNDGLAGPKRFLLYFDITILVLALSVIVVGLLLMRKDPVYRKLIWMAIALCGIGTWEFCITNLIAILAPNELALKGYLEYLSLYITPLFFTLYFAEELYYENTGKSRWFFPVLVAVEALFPVVALILHFADLVHLPRMLSFCHLEIVVALIYILIMSVRGASRKNRSIHTEMLVGTIALVVVALLEFGRYVYYKFITEGNGEFESIMLIGVYIFALCFLIDFFNTRQRAMLAEAKNEALEKMAYADIMTGLFNRQKVNEFVDRIVKEKKRFGIVNFDLNGLKKANDIFGHMEGDRLITDFAHLLKDVFSGDGLVARIGGDEFIVIYPDTAKTDHDMLMEKLRADCEKRNAERKEIPLTFAVGYSAVSEEEYALMQSSDEEKGRQIVRDIYRRADEKMYEDKAAYSERRGS